MDTGKSRNWSMRGRHHLTIKGQDGLRGCEPVLFKHVTKASLSFIWTLT